jgi:hypothetical protein
MSRTHNNRLQRTVREKCQGTKVSAPPLNRDVDMTSAVKCGGELIECSLGYVMMFSESAAGGAASTDRR